jgi:uncharacterized RDD family membrane protein YckC
MEQIVSQPLPMPHVAGYAGFWKRFAAYLIDSIIISIASLILLIPFFLIVGLGALQGMDEEYNGGPELLIAFIGTYLMLVCLLMIGQWLYFAIMESTKGATLGKMVLNIQVTDMQGQRLTFGRASGRHFAKLISGLTLGIGYIIAGFTQQKQALHDIIAGCLVVNK